MKPEPLKNKTFMNDEYGFPLLLSHFSDFEKKRRNSFSYTNDIKSAVKFFRQEIQKRIPFSKGFREGDNEDIILKLIDEAFEDVTSKSKKSEKKQ